MTHRPFSLVFAGGGARGFAHVGVLSALRDMGLAPAAIVGVSMGAIVGTTYALRDDWYDAQLGLDTSGAPEPKDAFDSEARATRVVKKAWGQARAAWSLLTGWGAPEEGAESARGNLKALFGDADLRDGRIPVTVCATDLLTGARVALSEGPAVTVVFASSSLAGILPPTALGEWLLVDGVYADIAPVDVARDLGPPVVIAVDPSQSHPAEHIANGFQAVMRAMEICHHSHARVRLDTADLVVRPVFARHVDVLDFGARRMCTAAGARAVHAQSDAIRRLLPVEGS